MAIEHRHLITISRTPVGRYTVLFDALRDGAGRANGEIYAERRDETEPGELGSFAEARDLAERWAATFVGRALRVKSCSMSAEREVLAMELEIDAAS